MRYKVRFLLVVLALIFAVCANAEEKSDVEWLSILKDRYNSLVSGDKMGDFKKYEKPLSLSNDISIRYTSKIGESTFINYYDYEKGYIESTQKNVLILLERLDISDRSKHMKAIAGICNNGFKDLSGYKVFFKNAAYFLQAAHESLSKSQSEELLHQIILSTGISNGDFSLQDLPKLNNILNGNVADGDFENCIKAANMIVYENRAYSFLIVENSILLLVVDYNSDNNVDLSELSDSNNKETGKDGSSGQSKNDSLSLGSKGDDVKKLQERLIELGYLKGTADGEFGQKTKAAVIKYQKENDLEETGIADANFLRSIYSPKLPKNIRDYIQMIDGHLSSGHTLVYPKDLEKISVVLTTTEGKNIEADHFLLVSYADKNAYLNYGGVVAKWDMLTEKDCDVIGIGVLAVYDDFNKELNNGKFVINLETSNGSLVIDSPEMATMVLSAFGVTKN